MVNFQYVQIYHASVMLLWQNRLRTSGCQMSKIASRIYVVYGKNVGKKNETRKKFAKNKHLLNRDK